MVLLILGLVIFLGLHSIRIFAEDWRTALIKQRGEKTYKALYSVKSIIGFVLIIIGYGQARATGIELYSPPGWLRHLASLIMLLSFVLLVCAYLPGTRIKARLHHPMVIGVKLWAFAHLLANGRLADVLLFGAFLAWAVADLRAAKARDRALGTVYIAGHASRDAVAVVIGLVATVVFARWLHGPLIGVQPF